MKKNKTLIGWREWVSLPDLNLPAVKAKVDTGAKTSTLHAFSVETYLKNQQTWVKFKVHPKQKNTDLEVECHALVVDQRNVTDSGGHTECRYVIESKILLADKSFVAQITLTNRDSMLFRMLLGRNALNKRYLVDPVKSFLLTKPTSK